MTVLGSSTGQQSVNELTSWAGRDISEAHLSAVLQAPGMCPGLQRLYRWTLVPRGTGPRRTQIGTPLGSWLFAIQSTFQQRRSLCAAWGSLFVRSIHELIHYLSLCISSLQIMWFQLSRLQGRFSSGECGSLRTSRPCCSPRLPFRS